MHCDSLSCDSLTSFPLAFFTKFETLDIWGCTNLESLYIPDGFHHVDLTSLQSLYIYYCANLVSFPQGGLPTPNPKSLLISSSKKFRLLPQGMHTLLTSLQHLHISNCPEIDSFPQGGLPSNLSSLHIWNCNKTCGLPDGGLQYLISLETLYILNCEKLKSFPKHGLPSSLSRLNISKRLLLKKRCQRDKGKEWPKICHIPCIVIEEEFILS
uniref:Disease resistance protein n=1 Tax=Vitis vinifera TaxID=29760 RepID=F6HHY0_VITVI